MGNHNKNNNNSNNQKRHMVKNNRNPVAGALIGFKNKPMDHRLEEKGGSRNQFKTFLDESSDDLSMLEIEAEVEMELSCSLSNSLSASPPKETK